VTQPVLWIVIPCYNEEAVLPLTAPRFLAKLTALIGRGEIAPESRICFVNDGSKDGTWALIQELAREHAHIEGICLSRNRGHQNAVLAGLMEARTRCDAAISIDCDGQDDINAIDAMVAAYKDGADVVYGVRSSRDTDTAFKRVTAEGFYHLLNRMGAEVVFNHADYRLMSKRALDGLAEFSEVNLYLRGLVPLIGYPSATVEYRREERLAGESHYPLRKMLALAFDGITSLSVKPIHLISVVGMVFALAGLIGVVWTVVTFFAGHTVSGWASTLCAICLFGGLQLLALGIIGEYVGKIYLETKRRPKYLISQTTWEDKPSKN
jgi:glycosyltransferase involved in cell wall biosynthesis